MSTSPVNVNSSSAASPASSSPASSSPAANASQQNAIDALGNPDTFLQLLVAQLQYQDPESPADGTTFVTQLATFAGVQEQSAMRSDLDSINKVAGQWSTSQAANSAASSSSSSPNGADGAGTDNSPGTPAPNGANGTSGSGGSNGTGNSN